MLQRHIAIMLVVCAGIALPTQAAKYNYKASQELLTEINHHLEKFAYIRGPVPIAVIGSLGRHLEESLAKGSPERPAKGELTRGEIAILKVFLFPNNSSFIDAAEKYVPSWFTLSQVAVNIAKSPGVPKEIDYRLRKSKILSQLNVPKDWWNKTTADFLPTSVLGPGVMNGMSKQLEVPMPKPIAPSPPKISEPPVASAPISSLPRLHPIPKPVDAEMAPASPDKTQGALRTQPEIIEMKVPSAARLEVPIPGAPTPKRLPAPRGIPIWDNLIPFFGDDPAVTPERKKAALGEIVKFFVEEGRTSGNKTLSAYLRNPTDLNLRSVAETVYGDYFQLLERAAKAIAPYIQLAPTKPSSPKAGVSQQSTSANPIPLLPPSLAASERAPNRTISVPAAANGRSPVGQGEPRLVATHEQMLMVGNQLTARLKELLQKNDVVIEKDEFGKYSVSCLLDNKSSLATVTYDLDPRQAEVGKFYAILVRGNKVVVPEHIMIPEELEAFSGLLQRYRNLLHPGTIDVRLIDALVGKINATVGVLSSKNIPVEDNYDRPLQFYDAGSLRISKARTAIWAVWDIVPNTKVKIRYDNDFKSAMHGKFFITIYPPENSSKPVERPMTILQLESLTKALADASKAHTDLDLMNVPAKIETAVTTLKKLQKSTKD